MKVQYENNTVTSSHFESVLELMDYQCDTVNARRYPEFMEGRQDNIGPTNSSSEEAINHALLGDSELYNKYLKNMIDHINRECGAVSGDYYQVVKSTKKVRVRRDFGDELDIHAIYTGQLDKAWSSMVRCPSEIEAPLVTLLIHIGGMWNASVTDSLWRAAATLKIVDDLTKSGKSVKVIVGGISANAIEGDSRPQTTSIVVKNYNEQISVERLAAMTHLGFYRTFCFGAKCAGKGRLSGGLGQTMDFNERDGMIPANIKQEIDEGKTKIVIVGKIMSGSGAVMEIEKAKKQLEMNR